MFLDNVSENIQFPHVRLEYQGNLKMSFFQMSKRPESTCTWESVNHQCRCLELFRFKIFLDKSGFANPVELT